MSAPPQLRVASCYSGAGGMDLGFQQAGFKLVWANDFEPDAVATHNAHLGDHALCGDIEALTWPDRGAADLVIGGPPCQGFSVAGHMNPHDPRSRHVFVFLDLVEHVQPRAFVMENVKALAANSRWEPIRAALFDRAAAMGYTTKLFLLNASQYGVPQARERMFLVGFKDGLEPVLPAPTTAEAPPTVREALAQLPELGAPGNDSLCTAIITPAKKPVLRRSPFAGMLFNGQGRPLDLDAPALTLPATMGGNRTPIIDQETLTTGTTPWVVGYHRRLWDGKPPVHSIPRRLRRITVQEAAALQTFPASWQFAGRQSSQFRQIGNAVPPELARQVALSVAAVLSQ